VGRKSRMLLHACLWSDLELLDQLVIPKLCGGMEGVNGGVGDLNIYWLCLLFNLLFNIKTILLWLHSWKEPCEMCDIHIRPPQNMSFYSPPRLL